LSTGRSSKNMCFIMRRKYYAKKKYTNDNYYIIVVQTLYKDEQYTSI